MLYIFFALIPWALLGRDTGREALSYALCFCPFLTYSWVSISEYLLTSFAYTANKPSSPILIQFFSSTLKFPLLKHVTSLVTNLLPKPPYNVCFTSAYNQSLFGVHLTTDLWISILIAAWELCKPFKLRFRLVVLGIVIPTLKYIIIIKLQSWIDYN